MCLYFANSQVFLVPGLSLSKVYANILLLLFNNRIKVVDGRANENNTTNSNWEEAFRVEIDHTVDVQPPSPIKKNAGDRPRSTSTVIVSNDRLVFRLGDMPPSPQRTRPKSQEAGPVERTRPSLEKDMTSSVGTRSDISLHVRFLFFSLFPRCLEADVCENLEDSARAGAESIIISSPLDRFESVTHTFLKNFPHVYMSADCCHSFPFILDLICRNNYMY